MDATSGFTANDLMIQAVVTKGRTSADLTSDTSLRDQLLQGLNIIQMDYCGRNDWSFLHSDGTIACTSGTKEYTITGLDKIEILYDKTNNRIIYPTTNKELTRDDPNEDRSGNPEVYCKWGDRTILLQPTPDSSLTLYYRAKILPTHISAAGEYLTVPYKYQKTILHGLKAWFYDIVDDQRADRERQLFEQGVMQDWEKDTLELDDCTRFVSMEEWASDPTSRTYEDFLTRYFG